MEKADFRVLLVSDMGKVGGTEIATMIAAKELRAVTDKVFVFGKKGPVSDVIAEMNVEQFEAECHTRNPFKLIQYIMKMVKVINQHDINIIHSQMARPVVFIWLAKLLSRNRNKIKVFWTSRGIDKDTYPKVVPMFTKMDVRGIGNCKREQQKLIRFGFPEHRTSYVYNAYRLIPTKKPMKPLNKSELVIGTLSALRESRRVDLFIRLAHYLLDNNILKQNVRFVVGGDGTHLPELKRLAVELGISDKVTFLGNVKDISPFMDQIDIFVSSLVMDRDSGAGLSNSIVEAMVMKVPVCSFDAVAIGEIVINGQTGYLIEPGNMEAMANAIKEVIENPETTEQYVNNAYHLILAECDPQNYAKKLISIYKDL
ncbi:glycosyltransferase family 4 protein [Glaesserella sp.]|uniref:glycosyltransferase family 4 protein n=1 Tax=Glaesserella sp. TaxID=2094731 RepID=UPI0035A0D514